MFFPDKVKTSPASNLRICSYLVLGPVLNHAVFFTIAVGISVSVAVGVTVGVGATIGVDVSLAGDGEGISEEKDVFVGLTF